MNPLNKYYGQNIQNETFNNMNFSTNQPSQNFQKSNSFIDQSKINDFKQAASMFNSFGDKNKLIEAICNKDPRMRTILQMCNGRDPKQVFINECINRGLDPNQLISQLGLI